MKDPSSYNVRAVERALDILNCFDDEHPERGVSEIAEAVDLHKATAHRIVTTLLNYGFLERGSDGQKYRLGLELTNLGFKVLRRMDLREEAYPYMARLAQQWDETCDLSVFDQGYVFYIAIVRGSHALTIAASVGQRLPAHATASGKLFLAHLPEAARQAYFKEPLKSYTSRTITSVDALQQQFEQIRAQGYATDDEELEEGIRSVAAPICGRDGAVIAALSMPSPTSRLTPERIPEVAASLKEATQEISYRMGCRK